MAFSQVKSTRDFFRIWFYWKKTSFQIFLAIVIGIMFFSYIDTPEYENSAKILLLPKTSEGVVISTGLDEKRISAVTTQDINTEIAILLSNDVIRETIESFKDKDLGLFTPNKNWYSKIKQFFKKMVFKFLSLIRLVSDPYSPVEQKVNLLKNSVKVTPVFDSNMLELTLRTEVPESGQTVLNRLLSVYIKHHNKIYNNQKGGAFFDDQKKVFLKKLKAAEKKYKRFQKKNNIVDLSIQNETNIKLLSELSLKYQIVNAQYSEVKIKHDKLKKALDINKEDTIITKEMRDIPSIVLLEEGIVPILIRRSEIVKSFTPESREYKDINNQIKMLRGEIRNEVEKALKTDELEFLSLYEKKNTIKNEIEKITHTAITLNQKERVLKELERQVDLYQKNYMLYASKSEDAKINTERLQRELINVSIADKPNIPKWPVSPNRLQSLFLSILLGLFTALFAPFILESLDRRLKTVHDIETTLEIPVICNYPEMATENS